MTPHKRAYRIRLVALGAFVSLNATQMVYTDDLVQRSTHAYTHQTGTSLELDVHQLIQGEHKMLRTAVIFVHGGGFYTGTRKEPNIINFCDSLALAGHVAINISYRLHLEGKSFSCSQPVTEKRKAIATAADDIRLATKWILQRADSLQIDPNKLFLAGSSAGAEAAFHAVYFNETAGGSADTSLTQDFRYAGMMAFAGAILDTAVITATSAVPTLMYHGNCDALVPYGSALHHYCRPEAPGAMLLHGSYSVCERLNALNTDVHLVTACGGQHGSAVYPIESEIHNILRFIDRVNAGVQFNEHEVRFRGSKTCSYGDWPHCDR